MQTQPQFTSHGHSVVAGIDLVQLLSAAATDSFLRESHDGLDWILDHHEGGGAVVVSRQQRGGDRVLVRHLDSLVNVH